MCFRKIFTQPLGGRILRGSQNFGVSAIFAKLSFESAASMRKKTKRQTKIQRNEVTKIRAFMKGVTKATPKMINKAQQAAMLYMNVRNAILEEVLKERTGLKTIPLTDGQKRRLAQAGAKVDELTLGKIEREPQP